MCRLHLDHIDHLDAMIATLDVQIAAMMTPFRAQRELLTTAPGIGPLAAAAVISEHSNDTTARIPPAEPLLRAEKLIHAFTTQPGAPEGEGSSANLCYGLAQPSSTSVSGPHARSHSHPRERGRRPVVIFALSLVWGAGGQQGVPTPSLVAADEWGSKQLVHQLLGDADPHVVRAWSTST